MIHHHFDFSSIVSGMALYGTLAYAARTIPVPANPWAKWLIGVVQFVLSNKEKAMEAMNGTTPKV